MRVLILRLEAPLMAFGGPKVDQLGPVRLWPGRSLLTGLLANALGWDHREGKRLNCLQERLRHAARLDRKGEALRDFHTVDLGQDHLKGDAWTTRGHVDWRDGGSASTGTHIRLRDFRADAACSVALALDPAQESPILDELASALDQPARPLFLGRKPCLPSRPLNGGVMEADSLNAALRRLPWIDDCLSAENATHFAAMWPEEEGDPPGARSQTEPWFDMRDWVNQIHAGSRLVRVGELPWEGGP